MYHNNKVFFQCPIAASSMKNNKTRASGIRLVIAGIARELLS
jgi:hypothetical protein